MSNTNTAASTAHKQAASEHKACAEHHTKAADCHEKGKLDEAKASSKSAMSCCDTASKKSATACTNADYHTEIELAAFEPNNLVPDSEPSPDKK